MKDGMITARQKEFVKVLESVTNRYHVMDVFSDFCAMAACSLDKAFTHFPKEVEERYMATVCKYTHEEAQKFAILLSMVVEALEERRESFLGPVLEAIGAANVRNGQFLTPVSVANLCARTCTDGIAKGHKDGELLTISDPACGAGVLLISQGEALLAAGIHQRDIFLVGRDIDGRACDITFIELTLLGYAARIEHANALTLERLSRPRWTVGYYLNGTQWRENGGRNEEGVHEDAEPRLPRETAERRDEAGKTYQPTFGI